MRKVEQRNYILDLGQVFKMATLYVNDEKVATLWKPPHRADITSPLRKSENEVRIEISIQ